MSDSVPPIPKEIWERLLAFLEAGKVGEITFRVTDGRPGGPSRIGDASFTETVRGAARGS